MSTRNPEAVCSMLSGKAHCQRYLNGKNFLVDSDRWGMQPGDSVRINGGIQCE